MKEYKITLDKERTLKFSMRSFKELEERTGKPVASIFMDAVNLSAEEQQKALIKTFMSSRFIADFIYCGLLHEQPSVSYDQVLDMIPPSKQMDIMMLALTALPEELGLSTSFKTGAKKKEDK